MNSDDPNGAVGKWVRPPDGTTERDAARYRWLRDPANAEHEAWDIILRADCDASLMDYAVDKAMRALAEPSMSTTTDGSSGGSLSSGSGASGEGVQAPEGETGLLRTLWEAFKDGLDPLRKEERVQFARLDALIARAAAQPSVWVRVADRMPRPGQEVLVYAPEDGYSADEMRVDFPVSDKLWAEDGQTITHWTPLPEPPLEAAAPLIHGSEPDGTKPPSQSIEGGAKP